MRRARLAMRTAAALLAVLAVLMRPATSAAVPRTLLAQDAAAAGAAASMSDQLQHTAQHRQLSQSEGRVIGDPEDREGGLTLNSLSSAMLRNPSQEPGARVAASSLSDPMEGLIQKIVGDWDPVEDDGDVPAVAARTAGDAQVAQVEAASAATVTVTTTSTNLTTPQVIGVNAGHSAPTSNWFAFVKRLGVNGFRIFKTPSSNSLKTFVGAGWSQDLQNTTVRNGTAYNTAVTQLRSANGRNQNPPRNLWRNPPPWKAYTDGFARASEGSPYNGNAADTVATLRAMGIDIMSVWKAECTGSTATFFATFNTSDPLYWMERWMVYRHSYMVAYWLYTRGVARIEVYNEPDLEKCMTPELWRDEMRIRSRAVQDLYHDMNVPLRADRRLQPIVTLGGFASRLMEPPLLGRQTLEERNNQWPQNINNASYLNLLQYSWHAYNKRGSTIKSDVEGVFANLLNYTQGKVKPLAMTEFNSRTAVEFSNSNETLDSPFDAVRMGAQCLNLAAGGRMDGIYAFKFTLTEDSSVGVKKNGMIWGDIDTAPYHIGDMTRGAEAYRLCALATKGKRRLLNLTTTPAPPSTLTIAAVDAGSTGAYRSLVITNEASTDFSLTLDLAAWRLPTNPPARVIINSVTPTSLGSTEVRTYTPPAAGGTTVIVPGFSTMVVAVPTVAQLATTAVAAPTVATHVQANQNRARFFGTPVQLSIGTSATTNHSSTSVALLKFDLNSIRGTARAALLQFSFAPSNQTLATPMPVLVMGIKAGTWTGATSGSSAANWDRLTTNGLTQNCPPLSALTTQNITTPSQNFVRYGTRSASCAEIAGRFTVPTTITNTTSRVTVDVSEYVLAARTRGERFVSFLMWRPLRHGFMSNKGSGNDIAKDDLNNGAVVNIMGANTTVPAASRPALTLL